MLIVNILLVDALIELDFIINILAPNVFDNVVVRYITLLGFFINIACALILIFLNTNVIFIMSPLSMCCYIIPLFMLNTTNYMIYVVYIFMATFVFFTYFFLYDHRIITSHTY